MIKFIKRRIRKREKKRQKEIEVMLKEIDLYRGFYDPGNKLLSYRELKKEHKKRRDLYFGKANVW